MNRTRKSFVMALFVATVTSSQMTALYAQESPPPFVFDAEELTGDEIVSVIEFGTYAAIGGWSSRKPCEVTTGASQELLHRMFEAGKSFDAKAQVVEPHQRPQLVTATAWAYMDELAFRERLSYGRDCELTIGMVKAFALPETMFNPDTGFLFVDGAENGAAIKIDGAQKGRIDQTFVLSVGSHEWETMKCRDTVDIEKNKTLEVFCDNK